MKRTMRGAAILAVLSLMALVGCRTNEANSMENASAGTAAQGTGGTAVGARGTTGASVAPTGTSTQRGGSGEGGAIGVPSAGQAGR